MMTDVDIYMANAGKPMTTRGYKACISDPIESIRMGAELTKGRDIGD